MSKPEASIIIPVFNQWVLSRQCLLALAESLAGENAQIVVVDNASTDATAELCPARCLRREPDMGAQ